VLPWSNGLAAHLNNSGIAWVSTSANIDAQPGRNPTTPLRLGWTLVVDLRAEQGPRAGSKAGISCGPRCLVAGLQDQHQSRMLRKQ